MKRMDVVKRKDGSWVGESSGRKVAGGATKLAAVRATAAKARSSKEPVTVKIHRANGTIQEERTYPRRADPKRSKG